jgi:hypothetical protein
MFIVFIVLAVIGFLALIAGLLLNRKRFEWTKLDGTYRYRMSDNITEKDGTQVKKRGIGIQKMKGIAGFFRISYSIPEFYQKLRSGDPQTIRVTLLFFGGIFFVLNTFLAIGTGLVESGDSNGWLVIGFVAFFIILTVGLHIRSVRQSNKPD